MGSFDDRHYPNANWLQLPELPHALGDLVDVLLAYLAEAIRIDIDMLDSHRMTCAPQFGGWSRWFLCLLFHVLFVGWLLRFLEPSEDVAR